MTDHNEKIEYIRNNLPFRVLLEGLAEECCELAQAALKTIRAFDGTNPTPMSTDECIHKLCEESGDVLMLMEVLSILPYGATTTNPKWERWTNRIKTHNEVKFREVYI